MGRKERALIHCSCTQHSPPFLIFPQMPGAEASCVKPIHFTCPDLCLCCFLGLCLVSGSWVMPEPPWIRQGHIFPTEAANGAHARANGLKSCVCWFWGRVWVNYSVAAALRRGAPLLTRGVWYTVCTEELGLVHLFLVFRNLRWRK